LAEAARLAEEAINRVSNEAAEHRRDKTIQQ